MKRSLILLAGVASLAACNTDPNPAATPDAGPDTAMPVQETSPATEPLPPKSSDPNVQSGGAMDGTGTPPNSPVIDDGTRASPVTPEGGSKTPQ